ncbi:MAG TPA: class I SAM-dependent methyltransferase [Acidobacteriota bacterium]
MLAPPIFQIQSELDRLLEWVRGRRLLIEIGTALGGTLFRFLEAAADDAVVISIDKPGGAFGGELGQPAEAEMQSWKRPGQQLHVLRRDSSECVEPVRRILDGRRADLIFFDGDHSYEAIEADYRNYQRFGKVLAFHDIAEHHDPRIGVKRFWDQIKQDYDHREFVADPAQGWAGIGLLIRPRAGRRAAP